MYAYSAVPFHMTSGTSAITCKATTPHTHCPSTLHKCMQMTAYHAFSTLKLTSYFYCRCRRYCHCLHPLRWPGYTQRRCKETQKRLHLWCKVCFAYILPKPFYMSDDLIACCNWLSQAARMSLSRFGVNMLKCLMLIASYQCSLRILWSSYSVLWHAANIMVSSTTYHKPLHNILHYLQPK